MLGYPSYDDGSSSSPTEIIIDRAMTGSSCSQTDLMIEIPKPAHTITARYTAHFMEPKPSLILDESESPTRSRYHHRRVHSISSAITQRSLSPPSTITDDLSIAEKFVTSDLSLIYDEFTPITPDALHPLENPYPRHGPARYIMESDRSFTLWSKRGWLNLGSMLMLVFGLMALFAIWPIYHHINRISHLDRATLSFSQQSGPFRPSELPHRKL